MVKIKCINNRIDYNNLHYSCFVIEPFNTGQSLTVANALRRTLLTDLVGTAITAVRINHIKHEFSAISGVREDVLELLLNLKEIVFRSSKICSSIVKIKVIGPLVVTASHLLLPEHVSVINSNQYIATVLKGEALEMELQIEQGKGYRLANEREMNSFDEELKLENESPFLFVDSVFSPIRRVNFKIKTLNSDNLDIKESLIFEIWTDRSITPKRALKEATKFLIRLFYPLIDDISSI